MAETLNEIPQLPPLLSLARLPAVRPGDPGAFVLTADHPRRDGGNVAPPGGGRLTRMLVIGIGGSALGPQFITDALVNQWDAPLWRALASARQGKWSDAREGFRAFNEIFSTDR